MRRDKLKKTRCASNGHKISKTDKLNETSKIRLGRQDKKVGKKDKTNEPGK